MGSLGASSLVEVPDAQQGSPFFRMLRGTTFWELKASGVVGLGFRSGGSGFRVWGLLGVNSGF